MQDTALATAHEAFRQLATHTTKVPRAVAERGELLGPRRMLAVVPIVVRTALARIVLREATQSRKREPARSPHFEKVGPQCPSAPLAPWQSSA